MTETVIRVDGASPYDVVVGHGVADRLPALLGEGVTRVAVVHPESPEWTTVSRDVTDYAVVSVDRTRRLGTVTAHTGVVDVTNQVVAYQRRRLGTGEEVAKAIAFMASPACPFMTGTNVVIDGGVTKRVQY